MLLTKFSWVLARFWPWRDFCGARWGHPQNNWRWLSLVLGGEQPDFPGHGCSRQGWSWAASSALRLLCWHPVAWEEKLAEGQFWMSGIWAVLWKSSVGQWAGREGGWKAWLHQGKVKGPSDHFYSVLLAANQFFCCRGLVLVTLTWGWARCCGQRGNHLIEETECGEGGLEIILGSSYRQLGLLV